MNITLTPSKQLATDRLMHALLTSIYGQTPGVDVANLLLVANSTPNPTAALELLTGIFVQPTIDGGDRVAKDHYRPNGYNATIVGYDPLNQECLTVEGEYVRTKYFVTKDAADEYARTGYGYHGYEKQKEDTLFAADWTEAINASYTLDVWTKFPLVVAAPAVEAKQALDPAYPELHPSGVTLGTASYLMNVEVEELAKWLRFVVINKCIDETPIHKFEMNEEQLSLIHAIHMKQRDAITWAWN